MHNHAFIIRFLHKIIIIPLHPYSQQIQNGLIYFKIN